jgi:hypothetical protein
MTVYRMPSDRPYQRHFRVFGWSAIAILLATALFAIYEPSDVSRTTNIALAIFMGAIVIVAVFYGMLVSSKEAVWKLKHSFEWELTAEKIIQNRESGDAVEIALNKISTLREFNGWLFVSGSESPKGIMIAQDVPGYDEIRRQLISRCPLTPSPKLNRLAPILPVVVFAVLFALVIFSHVPKVVVASGVALIVFWPLYAAYSLRRIWRIESVRKKLVLSFSLSWLVLLWVVYNALKAAI